MGYLIGTQGDGSFIAKFTETGVDPATATGSQVIFDSNSSPVRIFQSGIIEIPQGNTAGVGTITINFPDTGVVPAVLFSVYRLQGFDFAGPYVAQYGQVPPGSFQRQRVSLPSTFQLTSSNTRIEGIDAEVSRTQLIVRSWFYKYLLNPVRPQNYTCYYYIFVP